MDDPGVRTGLCALGLDGDFAGQRVEANADDVFESASLIKLLVLAALLRRVDLGKLSFSDHLPCQYADLAPDSPLTGAPGRYTVAHLARAMITASDNTATNLLITHLGFAPINDLARHLGLTNTRLGRYMLDLKARDRGEHNLTTAADMATLLSRLWSGDLLSPRCRRFALTLLGEQARPAKVWLPPGARFLHKTGELQTLDHDAGIVVLPTGAFALAALCEGGQAKHALSSKILEEGDPRCNLHLTLAHMYNPKEMLSILTTGKEH